MYKLTLIIRFLVKRRITHFAVLAVALCVFIVFVVMTVMTGLVQQFKQKNHEFVGDCVVGTKSLVGFPYYEEFIKVLETEGSIRSLSPVVHSYALFVSEGRERGVEIVGIDPVLHAETTNFAQTLFYRADAAAKAFQPVYDPNGLGCVVGVDVTPLLDARARYRYDVSPIRATVTLTCFPLTAKGALAKAATDLVSTQRFSYSDSAHTGIARVDHLLVYVPLEQAQLLCMAGVRKRINAIHVKFSPDTRLHQGCARVAALWDAFKSQQSGAPDAYLLDTVTVQSWKEHRRAVIAPMEKEQVLLSLMFTLVGVTTVFIVFVVFYMIISHKRKDIGILKSIGASNGSIMVLFAGFACTIGVIGSGIGISTGWLFLSNINRLEGWLYDRFDFQLWDRAIYAIGEIPHQVDLSVVLIIACSAVVSCLIGALVPAYGAARLRPVETLHVGQV